MEVIINPMHPEDWPAVRAIYEEGIATGPATFETRAPEWADWDQNHLPVCRLAARVTLANGSQQVAGWAALSPVAGRGLLAELIAQSEQTGIWHDTIVMERRSKVVGM